MEERDISPPLSSFLFKNCSTSYPQTTSVSQRTNGMWFLMAACPLLVGSKSFCCISSEISKMLSCEAAILSLMRWHESSKKWCFSDWQGHRYGLRKNSGKQWRLDTGCLFPCLSRLPSSHCCQAHYRGVKAISASFTLVVTWLVLVFLSGDKVGVYEECQQRPGRKREAQKAWGENAGLIYEAWKPFLF